MRQSADSADQRTNSPDDRVLSGTPLGRRTNDAMSHEESDLEPDVFPDWQPVEFITDGGRNAVELSRGSGKLSSTRFRVNAQMMTSLPSPFTLSSLPLIDRVCAAKACPGRDTNSLLRLCKC